MTLLKRTIVTTLVALICATSAVASSPVATEIPLPDVPAELREPRARANYIIEHFWDGVGSFSDFSRQAVEQSFADYISVFDVADESGRRKAAAALVDKMASNGDDAAMMSEIIDKYLFSTDSPVESEDLYILFLTEMTASAKLDEAYKIRPRWQLDALLKNRPGNTVEDFSFVTRDGRSTTLYNELSQAQKKNAGMYIMLIFYDPDCDHCRVVLDKYINDRALNSDISKGAMRVIAIYSGEERELWENHAPTLPESWIVGMEDGSIQENGTFLIRTLPTTYIVGADKKVLIKDFK